jgi:hypothetical protein
MNDFMQKDFFVISAALRAIYQDIGKEAQHVTAQELKDIADSLTTVSITLNQFVDRVRANPQGEQAAMVTSEPFEDVITLMWQIAWILQQKEKDIDVNPLPDQLRQLHGQLQEL